ncbi:hypothetical protein L1987_11025 [Smallanthus sonchifolius]|uniref:Uncharacterized protein n=1 Tax=Smallanthus sonchifolius TaxID=185202 RepID=A0ACB9JAR3_9ASTR|nr:hypothetical protein L1987_11025 [Smallanthus sonchifolius]
MRYTITVVPITVVSIITTGISSLSVLFRRHGRRIASEANRRQAYVGGGDEKIAGPMVAVTLSQYLLQVTSIMMVGHLGELALSRTSIANSLSGVTGFSLIVSLLSSVI